MNIQHYLDEVRSVHATGVATEHSYRPALLKLFQGIDPSLTVVNEPKKVAVGAPDFIFNRGDVPIGWCEAKDLDADVVKLKGYSKEQKDRYRRGLPNLLYTNGLDFEFLRDGERIALVTIADYGFGLPSRPEKFGELEKLLGSFAAATPVSITSAAQLAKLMAAKAAIIKDLIGNVLRDDAEFRSALGGQYRAFKADLLPHLETGEFADIYAETITYGMFAARLHDTTLDTFSRREALDLLPKSNPFLRSLFGYIAGPDLDDRIAWIVDDLADVLRASEPSLLFKDFGKFTARNDPFVHFYEDFLKEYNPAKRKSRGVWYTPEPVVDFIVRAVDDVLRTEFGLDDGLADTSKVVVDHDTGMSDPKTGKPVTVKKELHRVQILDPATGTGTFLAKAVQTIAARVKARAPGKWSGYVEQDLIPRLHGFELLMASYAMCHMKLDMQLRDTGYTPSANPPRLSVWLTNALEEGEREVRDLFFTALADEARGANEVKRNRPIMCVIGNPPYSGHSQNKGEWIERLMQVYKISPELKRPAQAKWLSDDYVKFIRMAEHLIERNSGGGVLGFITNHAYLDNPTFVDMRRHLLTTFDHIRIVDLHGNSTKQESAPSGLPDENVFDIRQGVAIIIATKRPKSAHKRVQHVSVWGPRAAKANWLWSNNLNNSGLSNIEPATPFVQLRPEDRSLATVYEQGFYAPQFLSPHDRPAPGIVTTHDEFAISDSPTQAREKVDLLLATPDEAAARRLFRLCGQDQWRYATAKLELTRSAEWKDRIVPIAYRPFDSRYTIYDSNVAVHRRDRVMYNYLDGPNLGLILGRQGQVVGTMPWNLVLCTTEISDFNLYYRGGGASFPLYRYNRFQNGQMNAFAGAARQVAFDPAIYAAVCRAANLSSSPASGDGEAFRTATGDARPSEVKVFDYIYGVLHAPAYRERYAEFLRVDFPRIPYPRDPATFAAVSNAGERLRRLHLMESAAIGNAPYPFTGEGDDTVASGYPKLDGDRVLINAAQGFDAVPAIAWDFPVGGYRPAQKWLKDRRGRALSWDDVTHYQRIVKVLVETDRIMRGIDLPLE